MTPTAQPSYVVLMLNSQARDYFQVMRERFNKARAVRMTAKLYGVTMADVQRAAYYW